MVFQASQVQANGVSMSLESQWGVLANKACKWCACVLWGCLPFLIGPVLLAATYLTGTISKYNNIRCDWGGLTTVRKRLCSCSLGRIWCWQVLLREWFWSRQKFWVNIYIVDGWRCHATECGRVISQESMVGVVCKKNRRPCPKRTWHMIFGAASQITLGLWIT